MSADAGEDAFLSRWARRKRGAEPAPAVAPDDAAAAAPQDVAPGTASPDRLRGADGTEAAAARPRPTASPVPDADGESVPFDAAGRPGSVPPVGDADMPPLESLSGTSDVSAFFGEGVSATLRRAALRRVFGAPEFNVRDGLNDYDVDFARYEPLGDTVTCGMKFHTARRAREAAEREAAEEAAGLDGAGTGSAPASGDEAVGPGDEAVGPDDEAVAEADAQDRAPDEGEGENEGDPAHGGAEDALAPEVSGPEEDGLEARPGDGARADARPPA